MVLLVRFLSIQCPHLMGRNCDSHIVGQNHEGQEHSLVGSLPCPVPAPTTPDVEASGAGGSWSPPLLSWDTTRKPLPPSSSIAESSRVNLLLDTDRITFGVGVELYSEAKWPSGDVGRNSRKDMSSARLG